MTAGVFFILLVGGLLGPGWLLSRALGVGVSFLGLFLGSAAILVNTVLFLDGSGIPLTRTSVAAGLGAVSLIVLLLGRRRAAPGVPEVRPRSAAAAWLPWAVPCVIALIAVVTRVALDPLSGYDNTFRWDWLARQMLRERSFAFYPPVSAEDFALYAWCDGIAPLVAALYFWAYACLGRADSWATNGIVIVQALLLFRAVFELASVRADRKAGWIACALLATSASALWGVAMGQETGLIALSLVAMFLFLERHRTDPRNGWLAWAGLAAGVGALAREYGLAFALFGAIALSRRATTGRGWLSFLGAAAVVALPWYGRNAVKTGHPLYNHDLGGLFPINPVGAEYLRIVESFQSPFRHPELLVVLAGLIAATAALPLVLGLLAGTMLRRTHGAWLAALLGVMGLWIWSVGQTSGGMAYSLRVLTPAIAIGAVLAAQWIGPRLSRTGARVFQGLVILLSVDAAVRSLYLPALPRLRWWEHPPMLWREVSQLAGKSRNQPIWPQLADAAGHRSILVSDPTYHAVLHHHGARPVPFFSPAVKVIFEPAVDFPAALSVLRARDIRFVLVVRHNNIIDAQMALHPFFHSLQASPPTLRHADYVIYDLFSAPLLPAPHAP